MTKEQLIAYIENKIRYIAQIHSQNSTALAREHTIQDALENIETTLEIFVKSNSDKSEVKEVKKKAN